jgi:tetratricopeptide (TPR) repeat protein
MFEHRTYFPNIGLLLEKGNYKGAFELYNQILLINANHENAQVNIGVIALMENKLDEGEECFNRFPNNPVSRINLALLPGIRTGTTKISKSEGEVFEKVH